MLFTLDFLKVAINLHPLALVVESPLIVNIVPPEENENLSAESSSFLPVEVVNTYLSSSNERNVSSDDPDCIGPVEFEVIVTSNSFLIIKLDRSKLTSEIFFLGRSVYKVFDVDLCRLEVKILKSLGLIAEEGNAPSHIPLTVVIPTIVREFCDTELTLEYVTVEMPGFVYETKLPIFTFPVKI